MHGHPTLPFHKTRRKTHLRLLDIAFTAGSGVSPIQLQLEREIGSDGSAGEIGTKDWVFDLVRGRVFVCECE